MWLFGNSSLTFVMHLGHHLWGHLSQTLVLAMQCIQLIDFDRGCLSKSMWSRFVNADAVLPGTFCDVHHGVSLQGDPFTPDLFTKEDPLLQAFASTQVAEQAMQTCLFVHVLMTSCNKVLRSVDNDLCLAVHCYTCSLSDTAASVVCRHRLSERCHP